MYLDRASPSPAPPKMKLPEVMRSLILRGKTWAQIALILHHPSESAHRLYNSLTTALEMKRESYTHCLYIQGSTGVGKTKYVQQVLKHFKKAQKLEYYFKNLERWWDGYDGHDVVLLDDPVPFNQDPRNPDYGEWLNILSNSGQCTVPIKGRPARQFRAKLIIVLSNYTPAQLCENIHSTHKPALIRRLQLQQDYRTFTTRASKTAMQDYVHECIQKHVYDDCDAMF